jgi:hypothetical protein
MDVFILVMVATCTNMSDAQCKPTQGLLLGPHPVTVETNKGVYKTEQSCALAVLAQQKEDQKVRDYIASGGVTSSWSFQYNCVKFPLQ